MEKKEPNSPYTVLFVSISLWPLLSSSLEVQVDEHDNLFKRVLVQIFSPIALINAASSVFF